MSSAPTESRDYETVGVDAPSLDRYAGFRLDDDVVIVFDTLNANAWIQSSATVDLDEMT